MTGGVRTEGGAGLAIGLISGTSMDGIDAALVACEPAVDARPWVLAFRTTPYPEALRARLRACALEGSSAEVARLHVAVGECFGSAALELLEDAGVDPGEVRCIGSHGQTLVHLPVAERIGEREVRATLQIGCPSVIAARTGLTTVADFRAMDMALGGEGAPLVPLLDWRCFTHPTRGRVLLNLGGIANLTALPPGASREQVLAFDTGPANVLLDAACRQREIGAGYDAGGEYAASGRADADLLARLRAHAWFEEAPPKSADIADFLGPHGPLIEASGLSTVDLLATLVELTVSTVGDAVDRWVAPHQRLDEVLVSGGGVHNQAILSGLRTRLGCTVDPLPADSGISPDSKEAAAFAYLALETLAGRPGNVPGATGATVAAVLGSVVRPPAQ